MAKKKRSDIARLQTKLERLEQQQQDTRRQIGQELIRENLGSNVKRLREERGETQHQLADGAGVHRITIVRIENGQHMPSLLDAWAIADYLEVNIDSLMACD